MPRTANLFSLIGAKEGPLRALASAIMALLASCSPAPSSRAGVAPQVERIETAPGVSLYVEKYGDGPNLVIVPNRLYMANEFRALAAADRTLILYDMRNRGASSRVEDGSQLTIMHDVQDVEALRAHFGAERVSLVGYSYLGLMIALYAAEFPNRAERLVQIGAVPRRWDTRYADEHTAGEDTMSEEGRQAARAWEAAAAAGGPETNQRQLCALQMRWISYLLVGNPANAAKVPDTCRYENEWPANFDRHLGFHFADIQSRDFPAARFAALPLPVLTIHGTLDRNAPYGGGREWAQTWPNGRLITVEGGAHQVWLDDSAVIDDIDTFLRGDWPARAVVIR